MKVESNQSGKLEITINGEASEHLYLTFMDNYYIIIDANKVSIISEEKLSFNVLEEKYQVEYEIIEKASRVEHIIKHMNLNKMCEYQAYLPNLRAIKLKTSEL